MTLPPSFVYTVIKVQTLLSKAIFDTEQIGPITLVHAPQMKSNIPLTKSDPLITLTFGNLSHDLFWNAQICFTEYD